jgi:hypothetical protein
MNDREERLEQIRAELRRQDEELARAINALESCDAARIILPSEMLDALRSEPRPTRVEIPHFAISV